MKGEQTATQTRRQKMRCSNQPFDPEETAEFGCEMVTSEEASCESCTSLPPLEDVCLFNSGAI